jgi:hypothetical protein
MRHLFTFLFLAAFVSVKAQIVNIPDANFKAALLAYTPKIDLNDDKEIQESEAQVVKTLNFDSKSILSLTGIEFFTALENLNCAFNKLSNLDVSKNLALIQLDCYSNVLTTLKTNKSLKYLYCYANILTTLDISNSISLYSLDCSFNKLVNLDLSKNIELSSASLNNNLLVSLDVSKILGLDNLYCKNNPNLAVICVDKTHTSTTRLSKTDDWFKDFNATWSADCVTGIEDNILSTNKTKQLLRIVNPLGQEMRPEQALEGVFIYQYSDGSTRKIAK